MHCKGHIHDTGVDASIGTMNAGEATMTIRSLTQPWSHASHLLETRHRKLACLLGNGGDERLGVAALVSLGVSCIYLSLWDVEPIR